MTLHLISKDEELKIIRNLKDLYPEKVLDKSIINFKDNNNIIFSVDLKIKKLSNLLSGMIFERFVGIFFEKNNYEVDYIGINNFNKPGADQGIDLICKKNKSPTAYVQCKYSKKEMGAQRIEQILYKGGNFIDKNEKQKCEFILAINKDISSIKNKQRFLKWNSLQNKTNLKIEVFNF